MLLRDQRVINLVFATPPREQALVAIEDFPIIS